MLDSSTQSSTEDYNGWPNRETWAMSLYLNNEYNIYREFQRLLKTFESNDRLAADALEAWITQDIEYVLTPDRNDGSDWVRSMINDMLGGCFRIDWHELVRANREE